MKFCGQNTDLDQRTGWLMLNDNTKDSKESSIINNYNCLRFRKSIYFANLLIG